MNMTPSHRAIGSRFLAGIAVLFALAWLPGCGNKAAPETPPETFEKRVNSNPNLSPEAQQAALQSMQAHQAGGRIRGQLMRQSQSQH
jgi:hypothetical protein